MKKTIVTLLISAAIALPAMAQESKENSNYIEVQGRAEEEVVPDEIYLRIVIDEKEFKTSLDAVEKEMIKKLSAIGIDVEKDLEVQNIFSSLQKRFLKSDNVVATKTYVLKVASATQADKAFGVFDQMKIANVRFERAQLSKKHPVFVKLYIKAAVNAKTNAAAIAQGLDVKVGRAIFAQSSYNNFPVVYAQPRMMLSKAMEMDSMGGNGEESPELNFKKIKVECTLQARFIIE